MKKTERKKNYTSIHRHADAEEIEHFYSILIHTQNCVNYFLDLKIQLRLFDD